MNAVKILAIALIVAGALGLLYGGFTYTKETHEAKLGPIVLSVSEPSGTVLAVKPNLPKSK